MTPSPPHQWSMYIRGRCRESLLRTIKGSTYFFHTTEDGPQGGRGPWAIYWCGERLSGDEKGQTTFKHPRLQTSLCVCVIPHRRLPCVPFALLTQHKHAGRRLIFQTGLKWALARHTDATSFHIKRALGVEIVIPSHYRWISLALSALYLHC